MATWVIEVTEFNYEARCDLRGCLEATMASEATKIAVRGNMHNDTREIGIADFKSGSNLTSEAIEAFLRPPWHLGLSKWLFQATYT